ncbi:MAG: hypothetical protein EON90_02060 [Brevundimonas sp.]|nr:MAG: hypothetical protein EON90_02060 [Brevundimonas sp.]
MANKAKGEAGVEIGGKTYTLVFNVNALCEVEYILDKSTDRILEALTHSPPLNVVRALLWGGLRQHHPDLDLIAAGDLIEQMGGGGVALQKIGEALQSAFPDAPEGAETANPRKGAAAGTGRRSSSRGSPPNKTRKPSGGQPQG